MVECRRGEALSRGWPLIRQQPVFPQLVAQRIASDIERLRSLRLVAAGAQQRCGDHVFLMFAECFGRLRRSWRGGGLRFSHG